MSHDGAHNLLLRHLNLLGHGQKKVFADRVGIERTRLSKIAYGHYEPTLSEAVELQRATAGEVPAKLFPPTPNASPASKLRLRSCATSSKQTSRSRPSVYRAPLSSATRSLRSERRSHKSKKTGACTAAWSPSVSYSSTARSTFGTSSATQKRTV
ncbi:MAG: hypothetical protein ACE5GX_19170 [Thermoanaerobaculia bacterium]